jgi:hypothetical protein
MVSSKTAVRIRDLSSETAITNLALLLRSGVTRPYAPNEPILEEKGYVLNVTGWRPTTVWLRISGGNGVVQPVEGKDPKEINAKVARQRGIIELEKLDIAPERVSKRGIIQEYGQSDPVDLGRNLGLA